MENHLARRTAALVAKSPEIAKTMDAVDVLRDAASESEEAAIDVTFEVGDTLWALGSVPSATKHVCLWLGANVMVEYGLDEAHALLAAKLHTAETSLQVARSDLDFVKEQITTIEVTIARVHNWAVQHRNEGNAAAAGLTDGL